MKEVYDLNDTSLLNYDILETLDCERLAARQREQYYINNLKPQLNTINAVKDYESYNLQKKLYMRKIRKDETEDEHEDRLNKKKIWYQKNKPIILAKERNRYNKKKINHMKEKMKLMEENIIILINS